DHGVSVMDVAISDDACQFTSWHRQHERSGTGGQQQPVVLFACAVFGHHKAAGAVDGDDLFAQVQGDAMFRIPVDIVEHDVLYGLLASQHGRQQDAVVVGI